MYALTGFPVILDILECWNVNLVNNKMAETKFT